MNHNHANFRVQASARSDKGRRPNNEDFVTSFEPTDPRELLKSGCIYIVADGVGGASVGERASQYAAEKVLYEYLQHPEIEPGLRLKQVISRVNREIFKYAKDKGIRMATTMTVAVVLDNSLIAANVGDSRTYLIRRNEVSQITRDHNIVGEMVRDGVISEAEALNNKAKNRLTRSIGGDEEVHIDLFGPIPLQAGDKIVLCSDGLTRYALKEDIANLTASGSPEQMTENLIAFAKNRGRGGADNISVITVVYEPSADLEATIVHPRPAAPAQPGEISETSYIPNIQAPKPAFNKWITWSASGLGIIFIATTAVLIAFLPRILPLFGATAPTPTLTINPTASFTPESTPTAPSATPFTPSATALEPTITATPAAPAIDCSAVRGPVNVRLSPSDKDASNRLGSLGCGDSVILTGRYIPENGTREWYQINYTDKEGKPIQAWVIANRVAVSPEISNALPVLDVHGTPVTPTPNPTPEPATTAGSIPTTNQVDCVYTIQPNDSMSAIARKFGLADIKSIACKPDSAGCDLTDPDRIVASWQVIIPGITAEVCSSQGGGVLPP